MRRPGRRGGSAEDHRRLRHRCGSSPGVRRQGSRLSRQTRARRDARRHSGPSNVPAALLSNSIQIGFNSPPSLLSAADNGLDLIIIAGTRASFAGNETNTLVARTGSGIIRPPTSRARSGRAGFWNRQRHDVPPLAHRAQSVARSTDDRGDSGRANGRRAARRHRRCGRRDGAGALAHHRQRRRGKRGKLLHRCKPQQHIDVLGVHGCGGKEHPDGVKAYRAALAEAIDYIKKNPDSARDIENKYLHFSSPRFPTYSLAIAPSDLQFYVDMARQMKMINNPIDPAKTDRTLAEAHAGRDQLTRHETAARAG